MNKNPDTSPTEKKTSRRTFLKWAAAALVGTGVGIAANMAEAPPRVPDEPTPTPPEPTQAPTETPSPEPPTPTPEVVETPPPELMFFKTAEEANQYLMDREKKAGFDRSTMNDEELRAHRAEQRDHLHRTIRFVISQHKFDELQNQGKDPQALIKKQIDTLNLLYKEAALPLQYSLETTLVVDWSVASTQIQHQHGNGVTVEGQGSLTYSWTDDTLWVMADDVLGDTPDQKVMYIFNPDKNGIDPGYLHEVIHHTGFPDLYWSRGKFTEGPLLQVRPYDQDLMCQTDPFRSITPATILGVDNLLENNLYYGPQHDQPITLPGTGERLDKSFTDKQYIVYLRDREGNLINSLVKNIFLVEAKDEQGNFILKENAVKAENESINFMYAIFDIGKMRIPVEKLHYIYSTLYSQVTNGETNINITMMVDPNTFEQKKTLSIEMVNVGSEAEIKEVYFDKQVLAYSQVGTTRTFTVWLDG